eukprot:m.24137 g.24137  ORF g.24137 m.24137 type:complete len:259 (+) comp14478_c0_seq1:195-971(+)
MFRSQRSIPLKHWNGFPDSPLKNMQFQVIDVLCRHLTTTVSRTTKTSGCPLVRARLVPQPARITVSEHEVNKSTFRASLGHAITLAEARVFVKDVSDPKANHNCWAAIASDGSVAVVDDGEPSGTSGRPILAALEKSHLEECVLVVTRYKKGPKLGAGGLTRAYGTAARDCISKANIISMRPRRQLFISTPTSHVGKVYTVLDRLHNKCSRAGEVFANDGASVTITVNIDATDDNVESQLNKALQSATRGNVRISTEA